MRRVVGDEPGKPDHPPETEDDGAVDDAAEPGPPASAATRGLRPPGGPRRRLVRLPRSSAARSLRHAVSCPPGTVLPGQAQIEFAAIPDTPLGHVEVRLNPAPTLGHASRLRMFRRSASVGRAAGRFPHAKCGGLRGRYRSVRRPFPIPRADTP
ncbi:protein of unassigned function [Methylobacterium oryzae CBMB20]|uniref:Protein of unassigned function n=1 Tax=Methylobacterium oryzae CBMB20 TaxID=693986 RepID=A0A089NVA1_9HYPH|nr:protein of unassigned function [Methylobacterium oryzae CBMB20]